jgi:hypothetical protein
MLSEGAAEVIYFLLLSSSISGALAKTQQDHRSKIRKKMRRATAKLCEVASEL